MMQQQTVRKNQKVRQSAKQNLMRSSTSYRGIEHPYLQAQSIVGNHGVLRRYGSDLIQTKLTIGSPNDRYEREADQIAERVSGRKPGHELRNDNHIVSFSSRIQHIQRYTEYDAESQRTGNSLGWWNYESPLRVSDDGTMAVDSMTYGNPNTAWTTPEKIDKGENVLKSQGSEIKLAVGSETVSGKVPKKGESGSTMTLKEVDVQNRSGGGVASLQPDCGTAARKAMGISASTEKFVAVPKTRGVETYTKGQLYHGRLYHPQTTPQMWSEEIFKREFGSGLSRSEALRRYNDLSPDEKDKFNRKYGIGKYAAPQIGQGITIGTEYDMPGFYERGFTWNFHFAGVILTAGSDYVTVENAPGPEASGYSWFFWMYGPHSKGQSFHEFHGEELQQHGSKYTTMVSQPEKLLHGKTSYGEVHLVASPENWETTLITKLSKGTEVKVIKKGANWRKVEVMSGPHAGKVGWISSMFFEAK